jgi:hypothetical protein
MPDAPKNEYHLTHTIDVSFLTKEQLIVLCQSQAETASAMRKERDAAVAQYDDMHRNWTGIRQRYERVGQKVYDAGGNAFNTAEERVDWLIRDRDRWRLAAQSSETQKAALDAAATSLSATGEQLKTVTDQLLEKRKALVHAEMKYALFVDERNRAVAHLEKVLAQHTSVRQKIIDAGAPAIEDVGEQVDWLIQDRDRWRRDSMAAASRAPAEPAPLHSLGLNGPTTAVGTTSYPLRDTPDPDYLKLPGAVVHWYRCKNEKCRRWVSMQLNVGNGAAPGAEGTYIVGLNLHVMRCPLCGHNHRDKAPS